jgi:prolyl 4-hydroxylase
MDFIGEFFLEDISICDRLIDFFNNSDYSKENQYVGHFYDGPRKYIDVKGKKSTDLDLIASLYLDYPIIKEYIKNLNKIAKEYGKLYPTSQKVDPWGILEDPKMQYYKPGEGYFVAHSERSGPHYPSVLRHLVFMTYLNTVTDGGGTEFINYNKVTNAVKGKTVIWPVDWTHLHRGITSPSQDKYILTGWFSYKVEIDE